VQNERNTIANKRRNRYAAAHGAPTQAHPGPGPRAAPTPAGKAYGSVAAVKLAGFEAVIAELEIELDLLRRATRYLEE
jgi:hypothetical protein